MRGIRQSAKQFQAPPRVVGGFEVGGALQRPPSGGLPIGNGLLDQAGLGVVLRQQLRSGVDDLGKVGFQSGGDALVVLLAGALQKRLVGGVLDESVLEAVGRLRRRSLLVKEFGSDQLRKSLVQKILVPRGDRTQQRIGEFATDRRAELRQPLCRRQPVQARHQRVVKGVGDGQRR